MREESAYVLKCIRLYAVHKHIVGSMEIEAFFNFVVGREQYVKPRYANEIQVQYEAHDYAALRTGSAFLCYRHRFTIGDRT